MLNPTQDHAVQLGTGAGRWVLLAMILGSSMAGIDATVVNIALPDMGRSMDATFADLQWTVSAYTLTLASLILWGGAAGDRFGQRRVFVVGVAWFALASLLCALAPTVGLLIGARALQGVGGALLTPGSLAIIESVFTTKDRPAAIGTWAGFSGVATAVAPFLGGWLLQAGSWRWIFVINLPLSVAVLLVTLRHVPESRQVHPESRRSGVSDWQGVILTVIGLGGLTWAVLGSAPTTIRLLGAAAGVVALALFVVVEHRSDHPIVPLRLFSNATFSATTAATFVLYGAIGCFFFLLVIELQVVAGFSPVAAGAALLPVTALTLLLSTRSGALAQRIGPRPQMTLGPLLCALGVLLTLRATMSASYWLDVLPPLVVFGLGLATFVAPLTSTALSSAPPENVGVASGVNNAVARSGSLLAVAVLPVLVGLTGTAYQDPERFQAAYERSIWVIAALFIAGASISGLGLRHPRATRTPRCRPDPVTGSAGH